jgi:hypothetical protein
MKRSFLKQEWEESPETKAVLYENCNNQKAFEINRLIWLSTKLNGGTV